MHMQSNMSNILAVILFFTSVLASFISESPVNVKKVLINSPNVRRAKVVFERPAPSKPLEVFISLPKLTAELPIAEPSLSLLVVLIEPTDDNDEKYRNITVSIHACFKTVGKFQMKV